MARRLGSRATEVEAFEQKLLDAVVPPVRVDVTTDGARYRLINGTASAVAPGDMMMADGVGIVASVIRGPTSGTRITSETRTVVFVAYAPAGVGEHVVRDHLERIRENVHLVAPEARSEEPATLTAP
jgi:DNA/RNA-binding domain of Phe-tRNA-synthetase-like protein